MLKSLDILIGLTVVLLALSMAVTVITQTITTIVNSRGRHLRRGLTDLLQQLDPALTATISKAVATGILTHPLVSGSNTPLAADDGTGLFARATGWLRRQAGGPRLGNVVHREEFTKLLMGLAAGIGTVPIDEAVRNTLKEALKNNGVADPDAMLKDIRTRSLELERAFPELAHTARQNMAILQAAGSDLVAKINNWFDQTMDRTSQRFTASTRTVTFVGAFLVAFGLQVDTTSLVNRLAADGTLRAAFVEQAQALQKDRAARAAEPAKEGAMPEAAATPDTIARDYRAFLAANGLIKLPSSAGWLEGFETANVFGMLLTALLLSLGAPFWYSTLGRLLQLRSALAVKDDAQRAQRQSEGTLGDAARSVTNGAGSSSAGPGQAGG